MVFEELDIGKNRTDSKSLHAEEIPYFDHRGGLSDNGPE